MNNKPIQRNFILGDSWLFYKIYTGPKTSDVILTQIIRPVARQLIDRGVIDKWFFIRYSDSGHHLRVRFHYNHPEAIAAVINSLLPGLKDFMDKDLVWQIQTDTYKRELERYGRKTMELAESLFYHDSEMIVNFLDMIEGDEGEELRWLFALRAMDEHLDSFGYSEDEKLQLMERLKTGFGEEFGMGRPLKKQLDGKYRLHREKIDRFMVFDAGSDPDYEPILEILAQKKTGIAPVAEEMIARKNKETLEVPVNDLMASYIHMLMNRLFKSKNRMHEMVCYDFLYRYYRSSIAKKKKKKQVSEKAV
ncbi:thiopeptide-type bacteriocin biosynthesis domain-containing protein [Sinomicrobium oceani]|uniref:Thiopeptide-type bacteriocin biosynthesis domain-containing protein n=1 Tax=Sinomicrobium oceani TaxID=1150368 RepID=A0A1K1RVZ0_9FLAO|nr:thiopeptide-type bacteriocin biosynthesis protein [Sinomicrobium oceani]SFW75935.1 thiopeptide-type bacteriocin biosynthesis domain-containing protein [Sinomicrobium oceani]